MADDFKLSWLPTLFFGNDKGKFAIADSNSETRALSKLNSLTVYMANVNDATVNSPQQTKRHETRKSGFERDLKPSAMV